MAKYYRRLKLKIQDILILIEDTKNIINLIKQIIKINNQIFQGKRANKGSNKTISVYRVL